MKDHYFSFVQCRGAVPVFWREEKSSYGFPLVKFEGSLSDNYEGFKRHLEIVQSRAGYDNIYLVNLLSSSSEEKKLIENYEYLVRLWTADEAARNQLSAQMRYAYYDIHQHCSNKDYGKLNKFIQDMLIDIIQYCNFTALKINRHQKKIEVLHRQKGVFRVNCYSCIDRSNIFQSRIASLKLIEILKYLQIELSDFSEGLNFFNKNTPFANLYRNLWADNADALSKQYTGTGSTESFAVRKGKLSYLTTIDHGMKSIFRVIRNFRNEDLKKQRAIDIILGQLTHSIETVSEPVIELQQLSVKRKSFVEEYAVEDTPYHKLKT